MVQQDEAPRFRCTTFGKVVLEMARDSFYSEVSVSPYKRDGKQVGWKGTLHYHDMGELDAFGKLKRKTTSKTTLAKGKRAATAELKQWRDDMEKEARGLGGIPERKKSGEPAVSEVVGNYLAYQLSVNEIEKSRGCGRFLGPPRRIQVSCGAPSG